MKLLLTTSHNLTALLRFACLGLNGSWMSPRTPPAQAHVGDCDPSSHSPNTILDRGDVRCEQHAMVLWSTLQESQGCSVSQRGPCYTLLHTAAACPQAMRQCAASNSCAWPANGVATRSRTDRPTWQCRADPIAIFDFRHRRL